MHKRTVFIYISYTGLMEPLGESQILTYLYKLATRFTIHVVSFEKRGDLSDKEKYRRLRLSLDSAGIQWTALEYHRTPRLVATLYDMCRLFWTVRSVISQATHSVIHARSFVPGLIALFCNWLFGVRYIFDIRGYWVAEKVASGTLSQSSIIHKTLSSLEQACLSGAQVIVCLTQHAVTDLSARQELKGKHFFIIPTCVDINRFRVGAPKSTLEPSRPFVLGCVGTVTNAWFDFRHVLTFYKALRSKQQNAKLKIVSRDSPDAIWRFVMLAGLPLTSVTVERVPFDDMPLHFAAMDAGIFFYKTGPAEIARCPTRMAEFLSSGVPCVVNNATGDVANIVSQYKCGVICPSDTRESVDRGVEALLALVADPDIGAKCRHAAEKIFALDIGVERYTKIYKYMNELREEKL